MSSRVDAGNRRLARPSAVTAGVALLAFVTFLVAVGPHLVHHLFEHGDHRHDPPCMYAVAGDRHESAIAVAVVVVEVEWRSPALIAERAAGMPAGGPTAVTARAPPTLLA